MYYEQINSSKPFKNIVLFLIFSILILTNTVVWAQNSYPQRPIKFIVPFPAGSATDVVGRTIAHALSESLGQSAVIENKAGANGILGAEAVKAAPADGYTLLITSSTTQAANVSLYKKLSYDPVKDFTPIGKIGDIGFVLMVKPDFPAKNIKEFIAHAKANPNKFSFGQGSSGSLVSAAMFNEMAGITALNVPYKGIPPAITDLMGGQIHYVFADTNNAAIQIKGSTLKGLGVTTPRPIGKLANIATISESLPNYAVDAWFGLVAPANLPTDVKQKLSTTLMQILKKPEIKTKLLDLGVDIDAQDSTQMAKTIESEIKKWAQWVKISDIKPE